MDPSLWAAAFCVAFLAGLIKGMVGFAMPMIMISGLSIFLPADMALAGLIGATVVTNVAQALRQGVQAAWQSVKKFRRFLSIVMIGILLAAQIVPYMPVRAFYFVLGCVVTVFGLIQLFGWRLQASPQNRGRIELVMSVLAGLIGGVSGIWGPPTLAYLLTLDLPKQEFVRVQGVVYGLGAVVLALGHLLSGVLNAVTIPFSAALIVPAFAGLWLGFKLQDRLHRERFITITLVVLILSGLNLLRRAVF